METRVAPKAGFWMVSAPVLGTSRRIHDFLVLSQLLTKSLQDNQLGEKDIA